MWGWPDAEEALRAQARAGSHQAAARRSGAAGPQVTAMAVVLGLRTVGPRASLRDFLRQRSQDASGSTMSDTPRPPPRLPQHALIWIVVAALVLVLVRAAWRG